jgi:TPR repeat protein
MKWYARAAELDHVHALYLRGVAFEEGNSVVEKNLSQAFKCYERAAGFNDAKSLYKLGLLYLNGIPDLLESNEDAAMELFDRGAALNSADCWYILGLRADAIVSLPSDATAMSMHLSQSKSTDLTEHHSTLERAAHCYRQAAELNHAEAACALGVCYMNGRGVTADAREAAQWYQRAADLGNANAAFKLALCFEQGCGVVQDESRAIELFRTAAERGNAHAMCNLGVCYQSGLCGVIRDEVAAVRWYERGAALNDAASVFNLGACYQAGVGMPKDEARAVHYFTRGAELNDADSCCCLGFMFLMGTAGCEADERRAISLLRQAASLQHAQALFYLGNCALQGIDCRLPGEDDAQVQEATDWFKRAAALGHEESAAILQLASEFESIRSTG